MFVLCSLLLALYSKLLQLKIDSELKISRTYYTGINRPLVVFSSASPKRLVCCFAEVVGQGLLVWVWIGWVAGSCSLRFIRKYVTPLLSGLLPRNLLYTSCIPPFGRVLRSARNDEITVFPSSSVVSESRLLSETPRRFGGVYVTHGHDGPFPIYVGRLAVRFLHSPPSRHPTSTMDD